MATPMSGKALSGRAKILWVLIFGGIGLAGLLGFVGLRGAPEQAAEPQLAAAPLEGAPENTNAPEAVPATAPEAVLATAPEAVPATAPEADTAAAAIEPAPEPAADPAPEVAATTAPADAAEILQTPAPTPPSLDVVRVDAEGRAVIAGQADAGASISLRLDGQEIAMATADSAGNFVAMLQIAPSDQPRVLSLEAVRPGNATVAGDETAMIAPFAAPVVAVADAPAPQTDTATAADAATDSAQSDASAEAPAIVVAGSEGLRVVQSADAETGGQDAVQLDAISYDAAGAVTLAGRGPAAASLQVTVDARVMEMGAPDPSGQWSVDLSDLAPGTYALRVEHLDAEGQVVGVLETPFRREDPARIRDNPMMAAPGSAVITVQSGFTLWGIAEANFGDGVLYLQIFQENRGAIRDPDLIYPGQIFALPDLPRPSSSP